MRRLGNMYLVLLVFLVIPCMASCGVKRQVNEMEALSTCEFRYAGLRKATLAGVDVSKVTSLYDLETDVEAVLFTAITFAKLPFDVTVSVAARNPTQSAAAVNRLEWILLIDDLQMGTGTVTDRVEIAPGGGTALIPIHFSTDLVTALAGRSGEALVTFGMNLAGTADKPSRITVKVKPTILVGQRTTQYPGYITLTREFSNGDLK